MKVTRIVALLAALVLAGQAGIGSVAAKGAKYDAVKQFSAKHNPNKTWSYLYNGSLLTQISPGCHLVKTKKVACWWTGQGFPNSAEVGANQSKQSVSWATIVLPPGYFEMDPEGEPNVAVQWTAPSAGTYTITGNFLGIDTNEHAHPVAVLYNGATIYSNTISSYGEQDSFSLSQTVAAGDTISFISETGSDASYLSTGLQATIGA